MKYFTTGCAKFTCLFVFLMSFFSAQAQVATITSTYGWTATVQIQPLKVIPSTLDCQWSYHYAIKYAVQVTFSGSTSNRVLHFNTYLGCTGGTGNEPYAPNTGPYTANFSTQRVTNPNHRQYSTNVAYNYGSNPSCTTITLTDANCKTVRLEYWGSGVANGQTTISVTPFSPSPLPIELLSFDGKSTSNGVDLTWSTAAERNNDFFTIERSSDGENFETIQSVKGNGTTDYQVDYSVTDKQAKSGVNYYRLTQTDYNGDSEIFDVIAIMRNEVSEISSAVFPNPTHDGKLTLKVNTEKTADLIYSVYSVEGKHISTESIYNETTEIELPTHQSNYFVIVQKGGEVIGRHKVSVY